MTIIKNNNEDMIGKIITVLFGEEFSLYTDENMKEMVFKIIRENPHDDFWKEENNEFLFEEIVEMCKKAGYQLILHKRE
jgi:hypothetical protein